MHDARARLRLARAEGDEAGERAAERDVEGAAQRAVAAAQDVAAAEHRARAARLGGRAAAEEQSDAQRATVAERRRREQEAAQRIRARLERRREHDRPACGGCGPAPIRRWRAPRLWPGADSPDAAERALDREIDAIGRALDEHGRVDRSELARLVGARYWGPGRFAAALHAALDEGRSRLVGRGSFAPPTGP